MRSNLINYRKRVKLGIIGALVICQIVFFGIRKFEFSPALKQDNRPKQASIIVINIKPPPKPKLPDPPPQLLEPVPPKEMLLPKPGPIKPVLDPVQDELESVPQPSTSPVPFVPYDEKPRLISGLTIDYPNWARKIELEGKVFVYAQVNMDGKVMDARVFKSSGYDILDEAAIQAVTKSRWQPAKQRGEPVSVWVTVPVKFALHQ